MAKEDRYFIPIVEVTEHKHGITHTIEKFGHAWQYSLQSAPSTGKWVKNRECTKEEYFSA